MARRSDKEKGPRPAEIAVAAVLSAILGLVGAAAFLAFQEPEQVSSMPEEEDRQLGVVYYLPGKPGGNAHATWQAKRDAVQAGRSGTISLVEEELNQWAGQEFGKGPGETEEAPSLHIRPGRPRFRIDEGTFHVGIPLDWNVFGMSREFDSQAQGSFARRDGVHVFAQERVYVGSMPVPNLFGLADGLVQRVVDSFEVSEELREGWANLESVAVEEESLQLVIP